MNSTSLPKTVMSVGFEALRARGARRSGEELRGSAGRAVPSPDSPERPSASTPLNSTSPAEERSCRLDRCPVAEDVEPTVSS